MKKDNNRLATEIILPIMNYVEGAGLTRLVVGSGGRAEKSFRVYIIQYLAAILGIRDCVSRTYRRSGTSSIGKYMLPLI